MEKAGVASPPQITLTTLAGKATGAAGSVQMFVHHEVVDNAEWRKVYDAFDAKRRTMHVKGQAVYQSADNPNDVIVTHGFKTLDEAKALAESSELKDAMGKAGVKGVPQIWFTTRAAN